MTLEVETIAKLEVRPGDLIVIRSPVRWTREQVDRVSSQLRDHLDFPVAVLILDQNESFEVFQPAQVPA